VTCWAVAALGAVVSFSLVVPVLQPGWTALLPALAVLLLSIRRY
jgi:hypothetical protein